MPFFSISGSEFVEMFVGVGASRVRDLFDQAKRNSPCIIFVDEIDAVGRHRGAGLGGSHDEREQTLNQILVEMDGFDTNTNVIVVAATNRPDILDPALLRPGRFDRQVVLDRPDIKGRKAILEVHAKGKPLDAEVNLEMLAKQTPGFSGADLANLVNEAAILAARRGKKKITMPEMNEAVDRVIAGPERQSRVISQKEREIIAYHEGGHALVGYLLPNADPPYKISIIARGMAGGFTRFLPEEDRHFAHSQRSFSDRLAAMLGGTSRRRAGVRREPAPARQDDLQKATRIARADGHAVGHERTSRAPDVRSQGRDGLPGPRDLRDSATTARRSPRRSTKRSARSSTRLTTRRSKLLTDHRDKLDSIVKSLLEEETIEGDALAAVLNGEDVPPPRDRRRARHRPARADERRPQKPVRRRSPASPGIAYRHRRRRLRQTAPSPSTIRFGP